ncbi:hypothetical protein HBH98_249950 [Parastagonospora nodorum]|nr:hypothetical protein HBH53_252050 [Parastagonospora nodorum]KAH3956321.1 hypothetical protein HBH51_245450 [Parastagonospora nodorum]KAH4215517.1 hypothetical protein HBI06_248310 [Parastagonospora nodorum]KAH4223589.1 hypothetical protein HBI05_246320 [Parastagonospora nodorum]KAH4333454.1 hypothetical protein HBH98_249950 [Parastagonospora nodorum]
MLLRCLELKPHIQRFNRRLREQQNPLNNEDYNPLTDALTDDDWDDVKDLVDFLEAPYEMTKRLEGNASSSGYGSLWQTLPNLQALWAHYTQASGLPQSQYMGSAIAFGLEKLNTYFDNLIMKPNVSYYAIATMLHPKLRYNWFQNQWKHHPPWYNKARKSIDHMFRQYHQDEADDEAQGSQLQPPSRRKLPNDDSKNSLYEAAMAVDLHLLTNARNKKQRRVGQLDEYFDALVTDLTTASEHEAELLEEPLQWWLNIGKKSYPILFKMAVDFLSIPATSCECERCFSSARRTITCDRNSLSGDTIEALQLQKNWVRRGVVSSPLTELSKHERNVDKKRLSQVVVSGSCTPTSSSLRS